MNVIKRAIFLLDFEFDYRNGLYYFKTCIFFGYMESNSTLIIKNIDKI